MLQVNAFRVKRYNYTCKYLYLGRTYFVERSIHLLEER